MTDRREQDSGLDRAAHIEFQKRFPYAQLFIMKEFGNRNLGTLTEKADRAREKFPAWHEEYRQFVSPDNLDVYDSLNLKFVTNFCTIQKVFARESQRLHDEGSPEWNKYRVDESRWDTLRIIFKTALDPQV